MKCPHSEVIQKMYERMTRCSQFERPRSHLSLRATGIEKIGLQTLGQVCALLFYKKKRCLILFFDKEPSFFNQKDIHLYTVR